MPREQRSSQKEEVRISPAAALDERIRKLVEQLGSRDQNVASWATGELRTIGRPAIPRLARALERGSPWTRW